MRLRMLGGLLLAALVISGQGAALAAAPDVNDVTCTLDQGDTLRTLGLDSSQVEAPAVGQVYRQTSGPQDTWETAYQTTDGRYWSRAGGSDVVVELLNPRNDVTFDVYKNNKRISSEPVSACDPFVTIPLPTDEGDYTRSFRYSSDAGSGPAASARFAIDKTAPVIASHALSAPGTATVTFSEDIVAGRNSREDWFVAIEVNRGGTPVIVHTQSNHVTMIDSRTRTVHFDSTLDDVYRGVDYSHVEGDPYVDAAGNALANTLTFEDW